MTVRERVLDAVVQQRQEIVALAQRLVRSPSVVGEEGEVQQIVSEVMREMDLHLDVWDPDIEALRRHPGFVPVERDYRGRPNVVGQWHGRGGGRSLILNGHVDVVPVETPERWRHAPWGAEIEGGRLFGRGAVDMKGGVAAMLSAVRIIRQAGVSLCGNLTVESVVEEELGGNGTLACALRGYRADAGIIAEPSGIGAVSLGNRGAQFFRLTVFGEEIGIEEKWTSVSALEKAFHLYQAVDAFSLMREAHVARLDVARYYEQGIRSHTKVPTGICTIRAGTWPSSIPGRCVMEGSLECLPGEDIQGVKASLAGYLSRVAQADPWLREHPPQLEWFGLWFEPSLTGPDHPIVTELQKACESVTGRIPAVRGGGGNDLRCLTLYAQTPSIIFGPGGGNFHGIDEYLELDQLVEVTKVLALAIMGWCGVAQ